MPPLALNPVLDRLTEYRNEIRPVVSLYLDLRPDQRGRDNYEPFLDGAFKEQLETFDASSESRASLERDFLRIRAYIAAELRPATQALVVFACSGEPELFEAQQLDAPIDGHRLYVGREPHLFPLVRLADQYPPTAVLLVNTNSARLYVLAIGGVRRQIALQNEKGKRVSVGGWSQARFQRHVENLALMHIKEVVHRLQRVVREDGVDRILIAGDEVAIPLLKEQLSKETLHKIVDVVHLDIRTPEDEVVRIALEAFRRADAQSDREQVEEMLGAYRAGGLATVGLKRVRAALELGQVDRLFLPAIPAAAAADEVSPSVESAGDKHQRGRLGEHIIEELVGMTRRTDGAVTFIGDAALLEPAGGVAATLRFLV
jgi:peptide chain release factor subunit 1